MGKNKILLVDDDPDLSKLLQEALEAVGCEVKVCDNGGEVLDTLRSYKPDLLLMDVMLPGMDGYSLAGQISGDHELSMIPMVVMSALTTSRCMFEGNPQVAAFFPKPFEPAELLAVVRSALEKKR